MERMEVNLRIYITNVKLNQHKPKSWRVLEGNVGPLQPQDQNSIGLQGHQIQEEW